LSATLAAFMALLPGTAARADDLPSPCGAIQRIVAAAPDGFAALLAASSTAPLLLSADPNPAACHAAGATLICTWVPDTGGLEAFAADLAACLPQATHDLNSPARQHFTLDPSGPRGRRLGLTASTAGANRLRLEVGRAK
jgi:hypothetical protein